ncbi:MAG: hypothetical protein OXT51_11195 [Chloroflexota bacterium]|nr:hypothetical protein [Chloroflexota bacterium]
MSRDSILLWCITHWRAHHRRMRAALAEHADGTEVVVLRSPRAVRAWLADVARLDPSRQAAIH